MKMQRNYKKTVELILIFCSVLFLFISPSYAWLSSWSYRQSINISNTAGDLTNYQVRLDLNSSNVGSNFNWSNNGSDIRFTDASDNLLNFWIESWNSSSQKATIWVNVTSLPNNTNTTIYMYYGNPSASSASDVNSTFIREIDGLKGSWHFDEGSGTTAYDSSGNEHPATLYNGVSWETGKFGYALKFDGSDDYAHTSSFTITTGDFSFCMWVYDSEYDDGSHRALLDTDVDPNTGNTLYFIDYEDGNGIQFKIQKDGSNWVFVRGTTVPSPGWHFFCGGWDDSTGTIKKYRDGSELTGTDVYTDSSGTPDITNITSELWFGAVTNPTYYTDAKIDEVTIYDSVLAPEEIQDLYNYYGYTTTNYPGRVLVRKYADPEPTTSFGSEEESETAPFSITLNFPPNQTTIYDSTPDFNFTVSGNESSYSCELFINDTGYGFVNETLEDDTEDSYSCGENIDSCANAVDEDWDTRAKVDSGASEGTVDYVYENYTIPEGNYVSANWTAKAGCYNAEGSTCSEVYYWNYTANDWQKLGDYCNAEITTYQIPSDGLNNTLQIKTQLQKGSFLGIGCHGYRYYWEGKVIWVGVENNTPTIITANNSLSDGTYNWYINCTAGGHTEQSEVREFTRWAGLNISVYYDNGTEATNWNISITNGTNTTTGTYNNSAMLRWNEIPYGEINITVDDGSDTLYYYQNTTNTTNNETNYQELNFTLVEKSDNPINLTANPSWEVVINNEVTVSCSALEGTPILRKDGVIISNPYTSTYAFGTYEFNCSVEEETTNYKPTSVAQTLTIVYPYGCINTEYGNQTFAYYSNVSTSYNITTLNFTSLVNQNLVKQDLSDVYVEGNLTTWINTTNGYYVIVNNTGYSNFIIRYGNYFINNSFSTHALTDVVDFEIQESNNYIYTVEFFDELTGQNVLPPNATNYIKFYCDGGTTPNLQVNDTKITFASTTSISELNFYAEYSPQERYVRTIVPESAGYYKIYVVDANNYQVAQMLLTVDDYTGEFGSNTTILKIKKETQGVLSTITERRLDAESKAIVYLIVDDKYSVYVDNGQEERGIGLLYVDTTDLTKTITIGTSVSLNTVGDFKFILGYNNQTNTIYMRVSDPLNQTLNASIWIYNYTSGELLYHASSTNHTTIEFTYIVPDVNGTYRVEYHIAHSIYGEHSISGGQIFALENLFPTSFPFEFPFAGDVQTEIGLTWQLFVVVIILIGITMMFGAINGSFAGVFIVIMGYVMSFMGWWNPNPMIMATALIFAIINLIAERLRRK